LFLLVDRPVLLHTPSKRKFKKPEIFPVTSDSVQLREFQLKEIKRLTAEVTYTEASSSTWSELATSFFSSFSKSLDKLYDPVAGCSSCGC